MVITSCQFSLNAYLSILSHMFKTAVETKLLICKYAIILYVVCVLCHVIENGLDALHFTNQICNQRIVKEVGIISFENLMDRPRKSVLVLVVGETGHTYIT